MPEVFDHFYGLLGTSLEDQLALVTLDPGCRIYFEGEPEPVDLSFSLDDNLDLFEDVEVGAAVRLERYLESARQTYDLARETLFYATENDIRRLPRELGHRAGALMLRMLEPLSAMIGRTVSDHRLRQILGFPMMLLGLSPRSAPSMHHVVSHLDLAEGVRYPMGGFARVVETIEALAIAGGASIRTGAEVKRIVVAEGKAVAVEYLDSHGAVQFVDADVVVSAADLHHTETVLLGEEYRSYPESHWLKAPPVASALVLHLGVKGELPQLEHHTVLLARDWEKGYDAIFSDSPLGDEPVSIYICKPSGVDPDAAPDGFEALTIHVAIPADPAFGHGNTNGNGDAPVEELANKIIEQIAEWTGIADLADRIVVRRTVGPGDFVQDFNSWRGAAFGAPFSLKQSPFFRPSNKSGKVEGLFYVGGSVSPGAGLPMCLISAEMVLKQLRSDLSIGPAAAPVEAMSEV
jgi:phytoene desaturase